MANQTSSSSPTNNSMPSPPPAQTTLNELTTELSSLNRVSHRLAMTDAGSQLQRVLNLLLPRLLLRIGKNDAAKKMNRRMNIHKKRKSPATGTAATTENDVVVTYEQIDNMHETIHKKLIEMIGHTMKRVREDRTCKLPCFAILDLLLPKHQQQDEDGDCGNNGGITANPYTINLYLDEQQEWLAHFVEMPNISAFADTPQQAIEELKIAWELVKEDYQQKREDIPTLSKAEKNL